MDETIEEDDFPSPTSSIVESPESSGAASFHYPQMAEVKSWLFLLFSEAGKLVPDFEYTPESISYLHEIAIKSQAKTEAASVVANDLYQKSADYHAQAARLREILEKLGLVKESSPPNLMSSARVLASVANLLEVRDTELSSLLVGALNLTQRKGEVEDRRAEAKRDSKHLLEYTRKAIARLTFLKRVIAQFEKDIAPLEAEMEHWKTNMTVLEKKESQYQQENANYEKMLERVQYSPEIRHGVLVEMSDHRKDMQKKTKAILESLKSYHDLPPDNALAAMAIEEKKRQFADAEKQLEELLQAAFPE